MGSEVGSEHMEAAGAGCVMTAAKIDASWTGTLFVISGPSGAGKTALITRLVSGGVCRRARTATTRAPREGERDGVDYTFYADRDSFLRDRGEGKFLETAEVHGHLYGTPLEPLAEQLRDGLRVVLNIDVQGAATLMNDGVPATYIFIEPPSFEVLERRLRGRGSDSEAELCVRLENAREEMQQRDRYDHRVVNDDLEAAVAELEGLLKS